VVRLPKSFPKSKRGAIRQHTALLRRYMRAYTGGGMFGYDTRTMAVQEPETFKYLTRLERASGVNIMKQIIASLEAATDEETGVLGLRVVGTRTDTQVNSASEGLLIAHDLIEHVNGLEAIGTIDDELEALGAIWYTRGRHNDISRNRQYSQRAPEVDIASDVVRMFREYVYGASCDVRRRYTRPCEVDDSLRDILAECKNWRDEIYTADLPRARGLWRSYSSAAMHRMRTGYRKAFKRWEHLGRFAANSAFWDIAEAVQPHCKPEFEGQRFSLRWTRDDGASCEETYDESPTPQ
jgi:hypothetical protein